MSNNLFPFTEQETLSNEPDYLWLNLSALPYFRALMRSIEARFYRDIELPRPVLDIGCGDGHFASVAFYQPLDVGLDPWEQPIREAVRWNAYHNLVLGNALITPFSDATFSSAISNSVLEHIPALDAVLKETSRVLKPGSPFIFCVPNHNFLPNLSVARALDRYGLQSLGGQYRAFFNHISRHYHCDPPEVWFQRLHESGFDLIDHWNYYPPEALHVTEWGHYFGAPALITRKFFGRWILFPSKRNPFMRWLDKSLRPIYENDPRCENGVCTFYITRKQKSNCLR